MKKIVFLILLSIIFSGCSFLRPNKMDIAQGNFITETNVKRLHLGMSQEQVKDVMGPPMLMDIFAHHRLNYVYTYQQAYGERIEKKLICIFAYGKLVEIKHK